jgi:DNA-binding Lrp family transcriptional regulator
MTDAFVNVVVDPGAVSNAANEIGDLDAVSEVYLVTGEQDLLVLLDLNDREDIPSVVADGIHSVSGVVDTVTNVAFEP